MIFSKGILNIGEWVSVLIFPEAGVEMYTLHAVLANVLALVNRTSINSKSTEGRGPSSNLAL